MRLNDWGKLALSSLLGVYLSFSFILLAALPIRYLRLGFGRLAFLAVTAMATGILLATQQWQVALVYFSLSFMVGCYSELESQKLTLFASSAISVGLTSILSVFCFGLFARMKGLTLFTFFESQLNLIKTQMAQIPELQSMGDLQSLTGYLPSGLVIILMVVLFVALTIFTDSQGQKNSTLLKSFTLPEPLIWLLIASLCGAFFSTPQSGLAVISTNVLLVTLAGYFFQGLAVVATTLDHYRVFGLWRMLIYFLIFFQLIPFVGLLGVLDLWFNFRNRLNKPTNDQIRSHGEEKS